MTTAQISFNVYIRDGTGSVKAYAENDRLGVPRSERDPDDARTGDAVLWMKDSEPTHFATFLMKNRSGEPVVYSKTGKTGPYEIRTTQYITEKNANFGRVTNYYVGRP